MSDPVITAAGLALCAALHIADCEQAVLSGSLPPWVDGVFQIDIYPDGSEPGSGIGRMCDPKGDAVQMIVRIQRTHQSSIYWCVPEERPTS